MHVFGDFNFFAVIDTFNAKDNHWHAFVYPGALANTARTKDDIVR